MSLSITPKEVKEIEAALQAWFMSQRLNPHDAAYVMAHMAAIVVGTTANDKEHMQEGLSALFVTMTDAAEQSLKSRRT